jgi:4-hydroxybenzoyl-CoA reductase subunit gamma
MHASDPGPKKRLLSLKLNGRWREDAVSENELLVDYLRDVAKLTGTKVGCDGGECGACTVLVDGEAVPSCITLTMRLKRWQHRTASVNCSVLFTRSSERNAASARRE